MLNQLSAVLLVSKEPERLVDFYERAFGLKSAREDHVDMDVHYGTFIGSVHLGIHPPTNFPEGPETGEGGLKIAFDTLDFGSMVSHLKDVGIPLLYDPVEYAWSKMTAIRDPDGNFIELLQPCNKILKAAATRGRGTNARVERFVEDGQGFKYKR